MSVIGIDFGNQSGVVAVARKGGVDILDNESGNRQTPNMVGFPALTTACSSVVQKKRAVGETALTNFGRNMKNTATNVKRWLGVPRIAAAVDKEDASRLTCPVLDEEPATAVKEDPLRRLQSVMFKLGSHTLRPEQVAAVFLAHLKGIGEKHTQKPVRDVVLSVPGWWGERQRRAMLDAAAIAGLNVLRLLNEHTAVALTYGIVKTDLPEEAAGARKVLFVDMGHSSTTAQVVAFVKGKMTVQGLAFDQTLGGRNFDEAIAAFVAADAGKKLKAEYDLRESPRAWQRILSTCEKQVKRVISAGTPRANLAIDNLANDRDYSTVLTKDDFVRLVQPLVERLAGPITRAMEQAHVAASDLFAVEVVGGGMRLPLCQEYLSQILGGREISKTINMEEGVAKGCALMCAMLSPLFSVKQFEVVDMHQYPIRMAWRNAASTAMVDTATEEEEKKLSGNAVVISKNNVLPSRKIISFTRRQGIQMSALYDTPASVPCCSTGDETDGLVGLYSVPEIPPASKPEFTPKLIVSMQLDIHGLFSLANAETNEVVEEVVEVEEPAAPPGTEPPKDEPAKQPPPTAQAPGSPEAPAAAPEAAPKPSDTPSESSMADAATTSAALPEKKTKRTEVRKRTVRKPAVVQSRTLGLLKKEIEHMVELELQMEAEDNLASQTAEAKNHLESYQYTMRERLSTASSYAGSTEKALALFGEEKEVASFVKKLEEVRDWLYGEGEDQTKGVYSTRLAELKTAGDAFIRRKTEYDTRPSAISDLEARLRFWMATAADDNKDEKYSHIDTADREKVRARCAKVGAWLTAKRDEQDARPLHLEPLLTVAVLSSKRAKLDSFASSIMNKPKPPPPKPAPASAPETAGPTAPEEQPLMTDAEPAPPAPTAADQTSMAN